MLDIAKKLLGLKNKLNGKFHIDYFVKIDGEEVKIRKAYFSAQEAVLSINKLSAQMSDYEKIREKNKDISFTVAPEINSFFKKDNTSFLEKNGVMAEKVTLHAVTLIDKNGKEYPFKNLDKYSNKVKDIQKSLNMN